MAKTVKKAPAKKAALTAEQIKRMEQNYAEALTANRRIMTKYLVLSSALDNASDAFAAISKMANSAPFEDDSANREILMAVFRLSDVHLRMLNNIDDALNVVDEV